MTSSRSAVRVAALAVGSALVAGCAVGPDYERPKDDVRGRFAGLGKVTSVDPATQPSRAQDASRPVAQWWTTFNDPQLERLVERAAAGNLSLRRAALRIREARAAVTSAGGRLYPQVNAGGGYARARGSSNVEIPAGAFGSGGGGGGGGKTNARKAGPGSEGGQGPGGSGASGVTAGRAGGPQSPLGEGGLPGVNTDLFQVGLDATWEIDVFGGVQRGVEAAGADLQAAVEDRRDVLVTLVAEVAQDYLQLRGLQRRLAIARQNLAVQEDTLGLVRSRRRAGFVTDLDVARAEAQVAQTRAAIPTLEAQARQATHALAVLAGEDPTALAGELESAGPIPAVPPRVPVGMPADLLRRRPDVRRAERQAQAATARVGVATAELYPRFSITGTFGFDSTKFKHLLDRGSYYFLLSPGVSWPVFEGGRIRANIDARGATREEALLTYREAVLTALRDVEDALVAYAAEQARHAALEAAVRAGRDAVTLARQQYERGLVDFQVVLDAQRELLAAEDTFTQSEQMIATDLVALYKALGGGWEAEPGAVPK